MAHLLPRQYHQLVLPEQGELLIAGSETLKQTLQCLSSMGDFIGVY